MSEVRVDLTTHHYSLLIGTMLTNQGFALETVGTAIEPVWFVSQLGGQYWHTVAYATLKEFCDTHGKIPSSAEFMTAFLAVNDKYAGDQRTLVLAELQHFVSVGFPMITSNLSYSLTLARATRTEILRRCSLVPDAIRVLQEAASMAERGDVKAATELTDQVKLSLQKHSQNSGPQSLAMGDIPMDFGNIGDGRVKLGIDFMDASLGAGAGVFSPCTAILLGPTGGGKTTVGNQICVAQALMGRRALMVVSEQGCDPMYRARIHSCATGVETSKIANRKFDLLLAAGDSGMDVNMVRDVQRSVDSRLHIYDMVLGANNLPDGIETEIRRLKEASGDPLEVVYIDWCGKIADRIIDVGFQGRKYRSDQKREAIQYFADSMAVVAAKNKVFIVLSHQLAAAQTAAAATKVYTAADSMECKGIINDAQYCFIFSPRDAHTKVQLFSMTKARYDPPVEGLDRIPVLLDGPRAQMKRAENFALHGTRIVKAGNRPNVVPKEG
jgi:RecA/RadA recombinase